MKKIYVGNLPYRISEQDLQEAFAKFGGIESVALIKDRDSGRLKGFGFITFESESGAQNSLNMNGQDFHGRPIKVSIAREKTEESGGRGGRTGGGRTGGARGAW